MTDKICDSIQDSIHPCDPENMRAAADWQLEQCLEEVKRLFAVYESTGAIKKGVVPGFVELFKYHMRSQFVNLPQANSNVCGEEGMERALQRTFEENDELMRKLADS